LATGLKQGTATISANDLKSGIAADPPATLTVLPPVILTITISPDKASIGATGQQAFTAKAKFSDGTEGDVTNDVNWHSSGSDFASIVGHNPGSATITATPKDYRSHAKPATANITVTAEKSSPEFKNLKVQDLTALKKVLNGTKDQVKDAIKAEKDVPEVKKDGLDPANPPGASGVTLNAADREKIEKAWEPVKQQQEILRLGFSICSTLWRSCKRKTRTSTR